MSKLDYEWFEQARDVCYWVNENNIEVVSIAYDEMAHTYTVFYKNEEE